MVTITKTERKCVLPEWAGVKWFCIHHSLLVFWGVPLAPGTCSTWNLSLLIVVWSLLLFFLSATLYSKFLLSTYWMLKKFLASHSAAHCHFPWNVGCFVNVESTWWISRAWHLLSIIQNLSHDSIHVLPLCLWEALSFSILLSGPVFTVLN